MPLVCIHCALVAFVAGETSPIPRDETVAEHMARAHPGGVDPVERAGLEAAAARKIEALRDSKG